MAKSKRIKQAKEILDKIDEVMIDLEEEAKLLDNQEPTAFAQSQGYHLSSARCYMALAKQNAQSLINIRKKH